MHLGYIKNVTVVGVGTMGHAVGQTFAQAGYEVILHDCSDEKLQSAKTRIRCNLEELVSFGTVSQSDVQPILERIKISDSLDIAVKNADLVIEAVFEDRNLKKRLFRELDALCPKHTIQANNTSEIVPSIFASATQRPDRVLASHYFYRLIWCQW